MECEECTTTSVIEANEEAQEIEATLHCIMAVQEAVPVEDSAQLRQVFGPEILGRLPKTGDDRVRTITLHLIGETCTLNQP